MNALTEGRSMPASNTSSSRLLFAGTFSHVLTAFCIARVCVAAGSEATTSYTVTSIAQFQITAGNQKVDGKVNMNFGYSWVTEKAGERNFILDSLSMKLTANGQTAMDMEATRDKLVKT